MKLIICHLGRIHNIHQRSTYLFHIAKEDLRLGNLKFVPKGEADELKRKEEKPTTAKQPKPKPAKEKSSKSAHAPKPKLVNEPDEEPAQPEPEPEYQGEGEDQDVERTIQMCLESFQVHDQAHVRCVVIREPVIEATCPLPVVEGNRKDDTSANIVRYSSSPADVKTGADIDKTNIGATTTTTTTTLPLLPPPQQQSSTNSELATHVTALERNFVDLEQKNQTLDTTSQKLRSKVFTLELRDLPYKINQTINAVVKEAVHIALEASLRDRFRELREADMNEILHQRMFESGSYKSLPGHVALYEALEGSMEWENKDKFLAEKDKLLDLAIPEGHRIVPDVRKPLPLGGPPEIVLHRADCKDYKISKDDFKSIYLNDFKDLYLLHLQGQLNHLFGDDKVYLFNIVNMWIRNIVIRKHVEDLQLGSESYQTKLNLTQPDWDASDFLFKEDYTIVSKPKAVVTPLFVKKTLCHNLGISSKHS
nr:hypothetical protein [Tanacetum cinerariifolium]